jgi:hypothetical protein
MTRSVTGTRRQPRVAARSGTCGRRPSDRIRTDPAAPGCGSGSPSGLHGCRIHPSRRPGCLTAGSGPGGEPREAGMQTRAAVGSGRLQSGGGRRPGVLERLAGWRYGLGGFALACLAAMRRIAAGRRHWPATLMIIWTVAPVVEVIWLSRRCRGAHRPCPAGCGRADAQEPGRVPAGQPDRRGLRGCAAAGFGVHRGRDGAAPSPTSPGSGSSTGPFSAVSSTNTSGPRRSPGQEWWPSSGTHRLLTARLLMPVTGGENELEGHTAAPLSGPGPRTVLRVPDRLPRAAARGGLRAAGTCNPPAAR